MLAPSLQNHKKEIKSYEKKRKYFFECKSVFCQSKNLKKEAFRVVSFYIFSFFYCISAYSNHLNTEHLKTGFICELDRYCTMNAAVNE